MPVRLGPHRIDSTFLRTFSVYSNGLLIRLFKRKIMKLFPLSIRIVGNAPTAIDEWHSDVQINIVFEEEKLKLFL